MEVFLTPQLPWITFFRTGVWLLLIYLVLKFIRRLLSLDKSVKGEFWRRLQHGSRRIIQAIILVYEPTVLLIFGTVLFLIDPLRHGPILLLLILVTFPSLKNYLNGRLLLLTTSLAQASRIETVAGKGNIVRWERLGLYLQTTEGLKHVPYSQIMDSGFTLISGEDVRYRADLDLVATDPEKTDVKELGGQLMMSPYLDMSHPPALQVKPGSVKASVLLKDEKYLPDLVEALKEWGWDVKDETFA